MTLGSDAERPRPISTPSRRRSAKRGAPAQPKAEFSGGAVYRRAAAHLRRRYRRGSAPLRQAGDGGASGNLNWLRVKHGVTRPDLAAAIFRAASVFEDTLANGTVIAGSPQTVRAEIERQVEELGINYLLTYLFLGTMSLADALRSLNLFSAEVMPHLASFNYVFPLSPAGEGSAEVPMGEVKPLPAFAGIERLGRSLRRVVRRLPSIGPQGVGVRHGDDVVAGIDEMDFAGDAGREIRNQIEPGAAEIVERYAAVRAANAAAGTRTSSAHRRCRRRPGCGSAPPKSR